MFASQTDKFSAFDDKGFPSRDQAGNELSKNTMKANLKAADKQEKLHAEYEAMLQAQPDFWKNNQTEMETLQQQINTLQQELSFSSSSAPASASS